jgi:hypothetical protein
VDAREWRTLKNETYSHMKKTIDRLGPLLLGFGLPEDDQQQTNLMRYVASTDPVEIARSLDVRIYWEGTYKCGEDERISAKRWFAANGYENDPYIDEIVSNSRLQKTESSQGFCSYRDLLLNLSLVKDAHTLLPELKGSLPTSYSKYSHLKRLQSDLDLLQQLWNDCGNLGQRIIKEIATGNGLLGHNLEDDFATLRSIMQAERPEAEEMAAIPSPEKEDRPERYSIAGGSSYTRNKRTGCARLVTFDLSFSVSFPNGECKIACGDREYSLVRYPVLLAETPPAILDVTPPAHYRWSLSIQELELIQDGFEKVVDLLNTVKDMINPALDCFSVEMNISGSLRYLNIEEQAYGNALDIMLTLPDESDHSKFRLFAKSSTQGMCVHTVFFLGPVAEGERSWFDFHGVTVCTCVRRRNDRTDSHWLSDLNGVQTRTTTTLAKELSRSTLACCLPGQKVQQ